MITTIAVGTNPQVARVSPDGTRVYVAVQGGLSVINTQTNTVVGTCLIFSMGGHLSSHATGRAPTWRQMVSFAS